MKKLERNQIPEDYFYYRSHSYAYFHWNVKNEKIKNRVVVNEEGFYGTIKHYFGGLFSVARFEKCDFEPTKDFLSKHGMKRGVIFWSGWKKTKPAGDNWFKLGYFFSKHYHHSTKSAFSILDSQYYWKKWTRSAKGHRNAIHKNIDSSIIKIDTNIRLEDFLEVYKKTKLPHGLKDYLIYRQKFISKHHKENFRIYLAYVNDKPLAGAIFLDDFPTSTYLIAFQDIQGKSYHLGLAIIDKWFEDSYNKGFKYMDLDHMKDILDSFSYSGYTKFKSNIADYELSFRYFWVRFIF